MKTHDVEAFNSMALTSLIGGLVYVGQTYGQGLAQKDSEEFLRKRLAPDKVALAAFSRGSYASLIPGAVDTVAGTFITGEPVMGFGRTTGLGSDFVKGIPTVDLIDKLGRAVGGASQAALRSDYDYSQRDAQAAWNLLFFQNALGVSHFANRLMQELPEYSDHW